MALQKVSISITFEYDPDEAQGMPVNNFLYHFLNRFNAKFPIKSVEYNGQARTFTNKDNLAKLPLRKIDSINDRDMPKKTKVEFDELTPRETTRVREPEATKLTF